MGDKRHFFPLSRRIKHVSISLQSCRVVTLQCESESSIAGGLWKRWPWPAHAAGFDDSVGAVAIRDKKWLQCGSPITRRGLASLPLEGCYIMSS